MNIKNSIEKVNKNKVDNLCVSLFYTFRKPTSWKELLFNPYTITNVGDTVSMGNTVGKRMQRWLIDNGDFQSVVERSLDTCDADSQDFKNFFDKTSMWSKLAPIYYAQSLAGHTFFYFTTAIILRFIELIFQSAKNSVNFSALNKNYRTLVSYGLMVATFAFPYYCLGYAVPDLLFCFFVPIILEIILPFKWSNYLKQINTLSSTKDFAFKNFVFKIIQTTLLRMLFSIHSLNYHLQNKTWLTRPAIIICKEGLDVFIENIKATDPLQWVGEFVGTVLGKTIFDLLYILVFKTISKDADLRNPMGWIFSKFRVQQPTKPWTLRKLQESNQRNEEKPKINIVPQKTKIETGIEIENENLQWMDKNTSINGKSKEPVNERKKVKTRSKTTHKEVTNNISTKQKILESETIEVNGMTFQRIYDDSFHKEVWGVIMTNRIEKQRLQVYEQTLAKHTLGGSFKQLTNFSTCYELGYSLNARLIGKMYYGKAYDILQNFMHLEDAQPISDEFGTEEVGLIIFSHEAMKHEDINKIAKRI